MDKPNWFSGFEHFPIATKVLLTEPLCPAPNLACNQEDNKVPRTTTLVAVYAASLVIIFVAYSFV